MDPNLTYKQQPELTIQLSLQQPTSSSSPTPPRPTALPTLPNASSSTKSPSVAQQLAERRMALGRKRGAEEVGEGERGASRVKVEGGRTLEGDESAGDLPGQPVASGSGSRAGTRGLGGLHSMLRGSWGGFASGSRGMVSGSSGAVPAVVPLEAEFPHGALRITRTPGRRFGTTSGNTFDIASLVRKESLQGAFISSFFIGQHEFFKDLPLKGYSDHWRRNVPIYLARDLKMESYLRDPRSSRHSEVTDRILRAGINLTTNATAKNPNGTPRTSFTKDEHETVARILGEAYGTDFGEHYHALYPKCTGCVHSKIMILFFDRFLRIIIGSGDFMAIDTEGCDNQFWVQDFFEDAEGKPHERTTFESHLCHHALALGCPEEVVLSFKGKYNFSVASARIVTSEPGTHKLKKLEYFGILRLATLVRLIAPDLKDSRVAFEICSASIGNLNEEWIETFAFFAVGGTVEELGETGETKEERTEALARKRLPRMEIVHPSTEDVKRCDPDVQQASSNIRFPSWDTLTQGVKSMLRHYISKDHGCLFHLKSYLVLNPSNLNATPHFLIVTSANFSAGAWGTVEFLKNGTPKVTISNYECGVVVEGKDIEGLLESGSRWEDAIPYQRNAGTYGAGEMAYNGWFNAVKM